MAGITGQGNTFNLPNYVGELFSVTPTDTPFLSAIGGLTGGKTANGTTQFQWQGYDLRTAAQNVALEGANAPTPQERVRFNVTNVLEVHHEAVEVSYTRQAASGQFAGLNIAGANPVTDEFNWQMVQTLKQIARDVEYSFVNGTYNLPTDNTTARGTRGILSAITTNVSAQTGTPAVTPDMIDGLLQSVWDSGGIKEGETATLMMNSVQKRQLTQAYLTYGNYREATRNVGGVNLQQIDTDFGTLNVMLNRFMPQTVISVLSLEECSPVFLPIPNKGFLFFEPLAKVGASERGQVYGEIGLEYGNEKKHGKLTGLSGTFVAPS